MIKEIKNDILPAMIGAGPKGPRATEREPKPDAMGGGRAQSFADQLMEARSERDEVRGRDDAPKLRSKWAKAGDKGEASDPPNLRSAADAKRKARKEQKADDDKADNLRSQTGAGSEGRMNLKPEKKTDVSSSATEMGSESKGIERNERFTSGAKNARVDSPAKIVSSRGSDGAGSIDDAEMVRMLEGFSQEQAGVKQQAMAEFMARMQSEFGIEPEKILEAFGKMDAQSLMAPPEETMKQFLNNLEIKPEQMQKAEEIYRDMVQVTGEAELGERLADAGVAEIDGVNFEILSPQDRALKQLNEGIDQLNSAFFGVSQKSDQKQDGALNSAMSVENMDAEVARLARMKAMKNDKAGTDAALLAPTVAASSFGVASRSAESSSALDSSVNAFASLSGPGENFSLTGIGGANPDGGALDFGQLGGESAGGGASAEQGFGSSLGSAESARHEMAEALKAMDVGGSGAKKVAEAEASGGELKGAELGNTSYPSMAPQGAQRPTNVGAGPAAMIIEGPKPTPQDEAENIRELVKQAQFMVKKGGGEMKLQMSPEGMGQVHLKVSVENGQVNVQMMTDNDASKKLLEDGLHELKASLAAHKLHVESMKVNMGTEIQKHMDQQAQQDASREQARQFAQSFMGQFRDERQGFRQGFMDSSGWKSYGRAQNRVSVEPETVAAASQSRTGKNVDGSKRLDLVA